MDVGSVGLILFLAGRVQQPEVIREALDELARRGYPTEPGAFSVELPADQNGAPALRQIFDQLESLPWVRELCDWDPETEPGDWVAQVEELLPLRDRAERALAMPRHRWGMDYTRGWGPHVGMPRPIRCSQAFLRASRYFLLIGRVELAEAFFRTAAGLAGALREEPALSLLLIR